MNNELKIFIGLIILLFILQAFGVQNMGKFSLALVLLIALVIEFINWKLIFRIKK